jgi:hypothetical protein
MQASIKKLEHTADRLHLSSMNSSSSFDEIKREIQIMKGLSLSRSQFPSIPQATPRLPSWQTEAITAQVRQSISMMNGFLSLMNVRL